MAEEDHDLPPEDGHLQKAIRKHLEHHRLYARCRLEVGRGFPPGQVGGRQDLWRFVGHPGQELPVWCSSATSRRLWLLLRHASKGWSVAFGALHSSWRCCAATGEAWRYPLEGCSRVAFVEKCKSHQRTKAAGDPSCTQHGEGEGAGSHVLDPWSRPQVCCEQRWQKMASRRSPRWQGLRCLLWGWWWRLGRGWLRGCILGRWLGWQRVTRRLWAGVCHGVRPGRGLLPGRRSWSIAGGLWRGGLRHCLRSLSRRSQTLHGLEASTWILASGGTCWSCCGKCCSRDESSSPQPQPQRWFQGWKKRKGRFSKRKRKG